MNNIRSTYNDLDKYSLFCNILDDVLYEYTPKIIKQKNNYVIQYNIPNKNLIDIDTVISDGKENELPKYKNKNYVGVEIECYSKINNNKYISFFQELLSKDISSKVGWCEDGEQIEFNLCDTEENIFKTLKIFCNLLKKYEFKTNSECGLHVHIDCYNRSKKAVWDKLRNVQNVLYKINPSRINNIYCIRSDYSNQRDHYAGISMSTSYPTVEVRIHKGTTDYLRIKNWINLLLNVIKKKKNNEEIRTFSQLKKNIKLTKGIIKYYNKKLGGKNV